MKYAKIGLTVVAFAFALNAFAFAARKAERANKYFNVAGTVLQIDNKERTLLVEERGSHRLYLISVPEGATFKITFGRHMRMAEPGFSDVIIKERVEIRCVRSDKEHLAQLEDGRPVIMLTAAS